jgi:hypothetical protein
MLPNQEDTSHITPGRNGALIIRRDIGYIAIGDSLEERAGSCITRKE